MGGGGKLHLRRRREDDGKNDGNADITDDDESRWMIADNGDDARRCGRLRKKGWMDGNERREGLAGDGASVGGKWATE